MTEIEYKNWKDKRAKFYKALNSFAKEYGITGLNLIVTNEDYYHTTYIRFERDTLVPKNIREMCYAWFYEHFKNGEQVSF